MAYASQQGRARISARSPRAAGVCDRCGFIYNLSTLTFQYDWRGASLANIRLLVCPRCLDEPQEQLRSIVIPADPVPVVNPRVPDYYSAETSMRTTSGQDTVDPTTGLPVPGDDVRITQNDDTRVVQQTGEPPGGLNTLPGTDPNAPGDADPGLPYGYTTVPSTGGNT